MQFDHVNIRSRDMEAMRGFLEEVIGVNHIAFQVDDAHQAYEELKNAGVTFDGGPTFVEASGRLVVNFRDPDGWRLQLADARRKPPQ